MIWPWEDPSWVTALNNPAVSGEEHTRTRLRMFLDGKPG